ncbi:1-acyl-sn-glycerol-3-phosphate acyltransferase [Pseudoprimorskyibacter insulae]|uniref:Glycerol-3-phosphate acyltransferase n=1 Tax=Pseudoprimorskyibacter insulae TaxID=1695997 RepID=A0A2R8AP67_9RHOB|nr:1-acyl-sn-glycerol-3-phosphate acyltransferase [Pseudoprimorskyibacter insulae]SPF77841.1 Putative acyltransferase plsB1 [Pseudoprimorskyibacter insulae]
MTQTVTLPVWLFVLMVLFAAVTFASHFLFPSVRWFFRRRMERAVARLNTRLERPIQPFKLLRRHDMIQRLVYDPTVTAAIVAHAKEQGVPEDVAFQHAKAYAREIVPAFSAFAYFGFAIRAARWLGQSLYRVRIGHFDEPALRAVERDATVVFVMNHRSNMDYVLVTFLAAERSALSYAVGEWAQVWPLSRLIKAMGAYFIRRKSRNALYRAVLARYVQMATAGGVAQAIFPEGGLSLTGAPAQPKLGLLKYITDGADLSQRDVVFVPVALNYDRVLEDGILVKADLSGERRFEARISRVARATLRQMWLRITGRFHRFGYAAVSFGAPLSLRSRPDLAAEPETLALDLMGRISRIVPVLPVPLVSYVLLQRGTTKTDELEALVAAALEQLEDAHVHMPRSDVAYAAKVGLRALTERGMVTEEEEFLRVSPQARDLVQFYARSIAHLF